MCELKNVHIVIPEGWKLRREYVVVIGIRIRIYDNDKLTAGQFKETVWAVTGLDLSRIRNRIFLACPSRERIGTAENNTLIGEIHRERKG